MSRPHSSCCPRLCLRDTSPVYRPHLQLHTRNHQLLVLFVLKRVSFFHVHYSTADNSTRGLHQRVGSNRRVSNEHSSRSSGIKIRIMVLLTLFQEWDVCVTPNTAETCMCLAAAALASRSLSLSTMTLTFARIHELKLSSFKKKYQISIPLTP